MWRSRRSSELDEHRRITRFRVQHRKSGATNPALFSGFWHRLTEQARARGHLCSDPLDPLFGLYVNAFDLLTGVCVHPLELTLELLSNVGGNALKRPIRDIDVQFGERVIPIPDRFESNPTLANGVWIVATMPSPIQGDLEAVLASLLPLSVPPE
jgi:hypothetical protein